MKTLDKKATWVHYLTVLLVVLGIWYVYSVVVHGKYQGPLVSSGVDLTAMAVVGS